MIWNALYVFSLTVWLAFAVASKDWHGLTGVILGATLGVHLHRYKLRRDEIRHMSGMTVTVHYHDAGGKCQDLTRDSPSSFADWTPTEKIRWIRRAERELSEQAERDSKRGAT